ncbi:uncharacterized protein METZ01_LOCUS161496 [marine metagenome]|uniref:Sulfotransferase domain-containing protein n=1 Tax=marine metagenome TaxID=408172 RepID=A0A382B5U3_9ZZZZ
MGYKQSLKEICKLLERNRANIISRLAKYHIDNRLTGKQYWHQKAHPLQPLLHYTILKRNQRENYNIFYNFCNSYYDKIIYCTRDPFEYSLSWGIRDISGKRNVYSIEERIDTHKNVNYNIDLKFMESKLDQYNQYLYWAKDNFPNAIEIQYDNLQNNIDLVLTNLTGVDFDMRKNWGISLQEYSVLLYNISLIYNSKLGYSDQIILYQKELEKNKQLPSRGGLSIKMNTLKNKMDKIVNFSSCIETYNNWIKNSNEMPNITQSIIDQKIIKESKIYK